MIAVAAEAARLLGERLPGRAHARPAVAEWGEGAPASGDVGEHQRQVGLWAEGRQRCSVHRQPLKLPEGRRQEPSPIGDGIVQIEVEINLDGLGGSPKGQTIRTDHICRVTAQVEQHRADGCDMFLPAHEVDVHGDAQADIAIDVGNHDRPLPDREFGVLLPGGTRDPTDELEYARIEDGVLVVGLLPTVQEIRRDEPLPGRMTAHDSVADRL